MTGSRHSTSHTDAGEAVAAGRLELALALAAQLQRGAGLAPLATSRIADNRSCAAIGMPSSCRYA